MPPSFLAHRVGATLNSILFLLRVKHKRIKPPESNITPEQPNSITDIISLSPTALQPQLESESELLPQSSKHDTLTEIKPTQSQPTAIITPPTPTITRSEIISSAVSHILSSNPTTQMVVFGSVNDTSLFPPQSISSSSMTIFAIDDLAQRSRRNSTSTSTSNRDDVITVDAVLDGCVWDSLLVLHGYNWQARSVWLVLLDDEPLSSTQTLDRHFRMISTLASPDSQILVAYNPSNITDGKSLQTITNAAGFRIEQDSSLVQTAQKIFDNASASNVASPYIRLAVLTHTQRHIPNNSVNELEAFVSEVTSAAPTVTGTAASSAAAPSFDTLDSLAEYQQFIASDKQIVRFELLLQSLPSDLKQKHHRVLVLGSDPCVGCWDPHRAKKMTGPIHIADGVVTADLSLSVQADQVEYKYAVTNEKDDIVAWETGCNRILPKWDHTRHGEGQYVQCVKDEWRS